MEKGATHYAHVFYPLTHLTAEKHDSFIEPDSDGSSIAEFAGKTLTQGEPDASSFPSGGLRATFEARGYTAWDVTSPAYILENPNGNTLCIPTVFISMTGEALDHKTPLLRSQQAMAAQANRVLKLFGHDKPEAVVSFAGAEQEYFLIDRSFFLSRPDLLNAGRTLFGAKAPKGQEFDDHYFGAIPERVLAFMLDAERELFKLGIPAKTRHNEVAPGQFEIAPMFERSNVAADHQQLLMVIMKRVARKARHGMPLPREALRRHQRLGQARQLLARQPQRRQLLPARRQPARQRAVPRVLRGGDPGGAQVRWSVAGVGGFGVERPPPRRQRGAARDHLDLLGRSTHRHLRSDREGRREVVERATHARDRRRHVARAAVGPRRPQPYEPVRVHRQPLRVPRAGALQSIAGPMVTINTILAEALDYIATELEALVADGTEFNVAIQKVLEEIITVHGNVVFNGDGYSEAWQIEAAARGLPNLRTTLDALPQLITDESLELFSRYGVFSHREMHSRYDIAMEQYILSIGVEARLTLEIANTVILPAALRYQTELATNVASLRSVGVEADASTLDEVSASINDLRAGISVLRAALGHGHAATVMQEAEHCRDGLLPAMSAVRAAADELETLVADDLWPLATYQEMLFIL